MKVVNYEVSSSVFSKLQDYQFGTDFTFQGKPYRTGKKEYDFVEAILLDKKGGQAKKEESNTVFVFKTNQQKKEAKLRTPRRIIVYRSQVPSYVSQYGYVYEGKEYDLVKFTANCEEGFYGYLVDKKGVKVTRGKKLCKGNTAQFGKIFFERV